MASNGHFLANLPVLTGKNYDRWHVQMKAVFGFQDLETVEKGIKEENNESKKKDCKALVILHQCVDDSHFEKIAGASSAKQAWDILNKAYAGTDKVKKVQLQTLRRQFEMLQMEENERKGDYLNRMQVLVNSMKNCGEKITDLMIIEKILRTLNPKFNHIVVAIEESKDLEIMTVDELQSSLEAHEQLQPLISGTYYILLPRK